MLLTSRTALITGGAVRIGRAIARGLAGAGMKVIVHYNSSGDEARELVGSIRRAGGEAEAIGADLRDADEVERLATEAIACFGGVDVLVNNASVFPPEAFYDVSETIWDETLAVNLKAPFFLTQHLAPLMRKRGGVVINMADLAGIQTWKSYSAHSISKAALLHFTRSAARSLAPEIRVVAIAPGTVLPPEEFDAARINQLAATTPLKRNGTPDDVVQAVLYLLSADFVTGEVLVIDGGRSAGS
ncbi:MAG TPA: SDR family oxidoreductase [Longimicrobiaceae bacterium]|nr:SDR family oxidoreductase [Longimicrobiaceae bacterium]